MKQVDPILTSPRALILQAFPKGLLSGTPPVFSWNMQKSRFRQLMWSKYEQNS